MEHCAAVAQIEAESADAAAAVVLVAAELDVVDVNRTVVVSVQSARTLAASIASSA